VTHDFKVGDHVAWNSEAGRVRGTIKKKLFPSRNCGSIPVPEADPQFLLGKNKN
jgi:hypothetical protein